MLPLQTCRKTLTDNIVLLSFRLLYILGKMLDTERSFDYNFRTNDQLWF
jgi:hypothetical protein